MPSIEQPSLAPVERQITISLYRLHEDMRNRATLAHVRDKKSSGRESAARVRVANPSLRNAALVADRAGANTRRTIFNN
jgi:hypothetical protein